jgi:hypothetical protein
VDVDVFDNNEDNVDDVKEVNPVSSDSDEDDVVTYLDGEQIYSRRGELYKLRRFFLSQEGNDILGVLRKRKSRPMGPEEEELKPPAERKYSVFYR